MIIGLALLPLAAAVLLAVLARPLADRLAPRPLTWLLTVSAAVISVATLGAVATIGAFAVAEVPEVAELGHWSTRALIDLSGLPRLLSAAALVLVLAAMVAVVRLASRLLREQRRVASEIPLPDAGDLVVVAGDRPAAFAVSGRQPRIVLTTALLDALPDTNLRHAVIEHERAHLRHHHLRFRTAVLVASRLNPVLRPVVALVDEATERWADADAAAAHGRETVARALLMVALAGSGAGRGMAPAFTGGTVPRRVQRLLSPGTTPCWAVALAVLVAAASVVAFGSMVLDFDTAEDIFRAAAHLGS